MTNRTEADISEAVRECAKECAKTVDVSVCLADYKRRLLAAGWTEADATDVIETAREVLDSIGHHLQ